MTRKNIIAASALVLLSSAPAAQAQNFGDFIGGPSQPAQPSEPPPPPPGRGPVPGMSPGQADMLINQMRTNAERAQRVRTAPAPTAAPQPTTQSRPRPASTTTAAPARANTTAPRPVSQPAAAPSRASSNATRSPAPVNPSAPAPAPAAAPSEPGPPPPAR